MTPLNALAGHAFDTSEYAVVNDGISRVVARDIQSAPRNGKPILLYGHDDNGLDRYEVGCWARYESDNAMWMWSCEYKEDGFKPTQWWHLPAPLPASDNPTREPVENTASKG